MTAVRTPPIDDLANGKWLGLASPHRDLAGGPAGTRDAVRSRGDQDDCDRQAYNVLDQALRL